MKRLMISSKLGISLPALGVLLLLTQNICGASASYRQEQQQSQPPPPPTPAPSQNSQAATQQTSPPDPPPGKQRKIWTNEDVVLLRSPADNYQAEKEAREAAEVEAAAKRTAQRKSAQEARSENKLPTSIEETQILIKKKEGEVSDEQAKLTRLNFELGELSGEQRETKQKDIEIVAAELDRARSELKALQDHLVELHKPPAGASTTEPTPPTPPPN